MGLNARENVNGVTPQDLNKLNNNFMTVWKTLFGGLDFSDTNDKLKKKIQTQQMPIQGEGNFDKNFPLYIRFFIPSNTKSITSTSINLICERYRMDSGVANDGGGKANVDVRMSLSSANTGVASVSSPSVGVSSVSSSVISAVSTTPVYSWYYHSSDGDKVGYVPPTRTFGLRQTSPASANNYTDWVTADSGEEGRKLVGVKVRSVDSNIGNANIIDLAYLNHEHEVTIKSEPHSHSISMQPHSHDIVLQPHTHNAVANLDLPDHTHELNEGIKISKENANGVVVKLNGNTISNMDSSANNTKNNIDVKDYVKIGEWNVLECTTSSLARITLYGIIELVMNY